MPKPPLSQERLAEIANQSFVTDENQKAFGVDDKEDVAQVDYKPARGITTSNDAENRNKAANETIDSITPKNTDDNDPFEALYTRISELQSDLNKAKESEKAAKEEAAGVDAKSALKKVSSSEEAGKGASTDMSAGVDAIAGRGGTEGIEDATIRALADKTSANLAIINNQMQTLGQYRQQFNEYTQQDIDSIARTAERSIQRQMEENQRTTDAMRFAGVVAGRAQFSPVPEQSIIAEVIQDGLDKVEVINEKKNSAIREARKAEAEFNVDVFEQQAELAKEYNNEIESTISAMNARVRQVEQDEREAMKFRQEQAERNAFILAPELTDATPEEIQAAAVANGVDPGLLAREVQAYSDEQRLTELDIEGKEVGIERDREAIKTQKYNRYLSSLKAAEGSEESEYEPDPMNKTEQEQFSNSYGWTPPFGMSSEEAIRIEEMFANEPGGVKLARAKEIMVGASKDFVELATQDIKTLADSDEGVEDTLKSIGKELGVTNFFGRSKGSEDILVDDKLKSYVQQVTAAADVEGVNLTTREIVDGVALFVAQDKELEKEQKRKNNEEIKKSAQTVAGTTANSTPAVGNIYE